jgi:starch synthase
VRSAYFLRLPVYFIEPLYPPSIFLGGEFHEDGDDFRKFLYFTHATLELLLEIKKKPKY